MASEWERLTAHIEADPESKERLGWVREMYAFSTAVALKKIDLDIVACPECPLIAQVSLAMSRLYLEAQLLQRIPVPLYACLCLACHLRAVASGIRRKCLQKLARHSACWH